MSSQKSEVDSRLEVILRQAVAPIYLVDSDRSIVLANPATAEWVGLSNEELVGRHVAYHSQRESASSSGLLTGLCPTPTALAGEVGAGSVSALNRKGELKHRNARFLPLILAQEPNGPLPAGVPVLVICETRDLTVEELELQVDPRPSHDQLHRAIRLFRRSQYEPEADALLMGPSAAAKKLLAQVRLATGTGVNACFVGPTEGGCGVLARSIHYATADPQTRLIPLQGAMLDSSAIEFAYEQAQPSDPASATTWLIETANAIAPETQIWLAERLSDQADQKVYLTIESEGESPDSLTPEFDSLVPMTIRVPALRDRVEDLPAIVQFLVECVNAEGGKQLAGATNEAIDLLALYDWPGGIPQLTTVLAEAHAHCSTAVITPDCLPPLVHHAALAASQPRHPPEPVPLDPFLEQIERELVRRALKTSSGNKAEAARLLGMNRPRFYRRLERLGMLEQARSPAKDEDHE